MASSFPHAARGQPSNPERSLSIPHEKVIDKRESNKQGKRSEGQNYSVRGKERAVKISSSGEKRNAQLDRPQAGSFMQLRDRDSDTSMATVSG